MELYRIETDNMTRIKERDLEKEKQLENRLVLTETAQIGGIEIFYIGRQGKTDSGRIFDILGVDRQGNTVVVELKRGKAPRSVISQALEYASEVRNVEYSTLNKRYKSFLREEQGYEESEILELQEAHADHFNLDDPLSPREFNNDQRLVVVGTKFTDDVLLSMADFLRSHGIDVVAVEYNTYADKDEDIELLSTDAIRRPLSQEPSTAGEFINKEWKKDGKSWHLETKTDAETGEFLQAVVDELEQVDSLSSPQWDQKPYIAFENENNERPVIIFTRKTLFLIRLRETVGGSEERAAIANRLGISESDVERTTNNRDEPRLRIRISGDSDTDTEKIREEIENVLNSK